MMINRVHIDGIRRRRSTQNGKKLVNETFHLDKSGSHQDARRILNASLNVARHVTMVGQSNSHPVSRLSLPMKPIGHKESKAIHRKDLRTKSTMGMKPLNNTVPAPLVQKEQAHRELISIAKPIGHTSRTDPLRIDDCHHLCLPEWIVDALRGVWAHFEKPPPPITKQNTDQQPELKYTFSAVRDRLREEKAKLDVDLDTMFARLGLDVSELREMKPNNKEEPHNKDRVPLNITPTNQTSTTPRLEPTSERTKSSDKSPTRKRVRRVMEYLTKQTSTPQSISGILDVTNSSGTSVPMLGTSSTEVPEKMGLDLIALKLCNIQSHVPPLPPIPLVQTHKKSKLQPVNDEVAGIKRLAAASRYGEDEVTNLERRLAGDQLGGSNIDSDYHLHPQALNLTSTDLRGRSREVTSRESHYRLSMIPSQLNRSLQEEMTATRTWWDLPLDLSQKSKLQPVNDEIARIKRLAAASRYGEDEVTNLERRLAGDQFGRSEVDSDYHSHSQALYPTSNDLRGRTREMTSHESHYRLPRIRSQLNRSLQEEMKATRIWWDVPLDLSQNSEELHLKLPQIKERYSIKQRDSQDHRKEKVVTPKNSNRSIAAPLHPMWDTPEELRTSVNLSLFHM